MSASPNVIYDDLWKGPWGDQQKFGPVHRRQREQLLKLVAKLEVSSVLDVGCGSGDNLAALRERFPKMELCGSDVSNSALALARKRLPGASFHQMDAQSGKLDRKFDLVLSNQVIEHLPDDVSALRNMALMARRFVLVATVRGTMRKSEKKIGHVRNYSDQELRAKASRAGLEVVDLFGWGFPFYSPIFRTLIEYLPSGPPTGEMSPAQKRVANFLYHLYGFNLPRCGDVVTMLAKPR